MNVKIRMNKSMLALLGGDPEFFEPPLNDLPTALLQKAAAPLTEIDGIVVPALNPTLTWVHDETETECFWSSFHLEDLVPGPTTRDEMARTALDYVWPLRSAVSNSHLSGMFRMIASLEDLGIGQSEARCVIRFHRVRPGQTWAHEDLESYKHEAIAVCDFTVPW